MARISDGLLSSLGAPSCPQGQGSFSALPKGWRPFDGASPAVAWVGHGPTRGDLISRIFYFVKGLQSAAHCGFAHLNPDVESLKALPTLPVLCGK